VGEEERKEKLLTYFWALDAMTFANRRGWMERRAEAGGGALQAKLNLPNHPVFHGHGILHGRKIILFFSVFVAVN